jgi:hypothetical protein
MEVATKISVDYKMVRSLNFDQEFKCRTGRDVTGSICEIFFNRLLRSCETEVNKTSDSTAEIRTGHIPNAGSTRSGCANPVCHRGSWYSRHRAQYGLTFMKGVTGYEQKHTN